MAAGIILLVATACITGFRQWEIHAYAEKSTAYVQTLRSLLPEVQGAVPEARYDNTMAAFSVEETDFIGILEMPRFGAAMPVGAAWGQSAKYPCHFDGSVYNRTLQLGGTTQKGQFDFYREISVGDVLYFTDVEGNRFAYRVEDIRYEKHADQSALRRREADLKLFIKNEYAFEYIIVFCNVMR